MNTFPCPKAFYAPGAFVARVNGTCMQPEFPHGARVIFHPASVATIRGGKAYCIRFTDGRWALKQLWRVPGRPDVLRVWCHNHRTHPAPWELPFADVASVAEAVAVFTSTTEGRAAA